MGVGYAEPANKRARLESVIPVKTTPLPAATAAQPAPPRSVYLDSCRQPNAAISTREANSGGAGAAKVREESSLDPCGWPRPGAETGAGSGAAAQAAGAAGDSPSR